MKIPLIAMTLLTLCLTCAISQGTLYGIPKGMSYFKLYKGKWSETNKQKDLTVKEYTETSFSHMHNVFKIYKAYDFGNRLGAGFMETVIIANQMDRECDAVLYRNRRSYYFSGVPDEKSKIFVMVNKNPKITNENEKYLIIDFSGCPAKPPTYKLSAKKPKESE